MFASPLVAPGRNADWRGCCADIGFQMHQTGMNQSELGLGTLSGVSHFPTLSLSLRWLTD